MIEYILRHQLVHCQSNLENGPSAVRLLSHRKTRIMYIKPTHQGHPDIYYNSSPDLGTSNLAVNQMVILVNSGSYTNDTYYFDNIRIGSTKLPDTFTPGVVYEDYQTVHNITFRDAIGTYTANTPNPSASGINTFKIGRYVENRLSV